MVERRDQILDCAEALMKRSGFAGFSYADIAAQIGIRKASIHYHFPNKSDVAQAAVARYRTQMRRALAGIDLAAVGSEGAVKGLVDIFRSAFMGAGAGCLCGSLAADWSELPAPVQEEVRLYWSETTGWLETALNRTQPELGAPGAQALLIFSMLEGAMTSARVLQDAAIFTTTEAAALTIIRNAP